MSAATTTRKPNSASMAIRAKRLGYHWSNSLGYFLRLRPSLVSTEFFADLAPRNDVPPLGDGPKGSYYEWWEGEDYGESILATFSALNLEVAEPKTIRVNEDGEIVEDAAGASGSGTPS